MSSRSVAVVVVTYNSEALLQDLVRSLPDGMGRETKWTLVIADNHSSDGTVETLAQLAPDSQIIQMGRNAGYAAGINAAVRRAGSHDAYLILNPDVRLGLDCVPRLLEVATQPGIGIAVPRLSDARGNLILSMRREPSVLRAIGDTLLGAERAGRWPALGEVVSNPKLYAVQAETDWAEGSTQLVTEECWQACAPWDERFFLYSEEADFDLRARDAGFATVYAPEARAIHLEGGSASSAPLWALLQTNRVRLFASRHSVWATAVFWIATVLREGSRSALGRPQSRAALRALLSPRSFRERPGPHLIPPPQRPKSATDPT